MFNSGANNAIGPQSLTSIIPPAGGTAAIGTARAFARK
jgi:hypothetical protein